MFLGYRGLVWGASQWEQVWNMLKIWQSLPPAGMLAAWQAQPKL